MIKIDFHLHTVATLSDAVFVFDINTIKKYFADAGLDAIAITNHNMFDLSQYYKINEEIGGKVYPGIEINLEDGHLLLISDENDLIDFAKKCAEIEKLIKTPNDIISVDQLKEIYQDLGKYILIPHYDKKPSLSENYIQNLSPYITAGEVSSPKKFIYCTKDSSDLVPVYFSDSRMSENLKTMPVRQTFLTCETAEFSAVKNCLSDKRKVFLSREEGNNLFKIFDDGQQLSTGLNVVLGGRSSGKSHTLDKISREFNKSETKVKYIEQFSLISGNKKKESEEFERSIEEKNSLLSDQYLKQFQSVINDVIPIDLEKDEKIISNYIESLIKHANQSERLDIFSKAKLFREEQFEVLDQSGLSKLITSVRHLHSNIDFRSTIDKYVPLGKLKQLLVDLMGQYTLNEEEKLKCEWINDLIRDIRSKLAIKTAITQIEEVDLYKVIINLTKTKKFDTIARLVRLERIIESKQIQRFRIIAKSSSFNGAAEIKKISGTNKGFGDAFKKYEKPFEYLRELKKIEGIEARDYYKFFAKIEYKILNEDEAEISGGETAEFNLLQEIQDSNKYDILLIDEPESSFDNLFLKKEVNEIIKDISKNMPVVLVTHNSTVGASINPDYILFTKKERINGEVKYKIYSGVPTSKDLLSTNGEKLSTFEVTMSCLEAGETSYNERKKIYESLKN